MDHRRNISQCIDKKKASATRVAEAMVHRYMP